MMLVKRLKTRMKRRQMFVNEHQIDIDGILFGVVMVGIPLAGLGWVGRLLGFW